MQVCLVTPRFDVADAYGGEVSVKLLADELARRGVRVRVAAARVDGDAAAYEVRRTPMTPRALAAAVAGSDVVHAYNMDGLEPALRAARRARVPAVATANSYWATCLWADMCWPDGEVCTRCTMTGLEHCYETRNPLTVGRRVPAVLGRLEVARRTLWLRRYDGIIVLSEASRRQMAGAGVPYDRMTVVPNMADPGLPAPDAPLPPLAAEPHVLSVGALKHTKGHAVLLDALPALAARVPRVRVTIVGDGPERAPLEARARRLGVADRVAFAGRVPPADLPALYRSAAAVAFPVLWVEPGGRVTLEAFAHGAPLVASDRGGPGDTVRDGENGLRVPADHPDALADALARVLTDRALAERLRAGGRATLADFAPDRIVPRILAAYEGARR